ncbi:MAG: hypothetical protein KKD44_27035 [Proteobacteria bacterium]|nr:hypothetical protein [Pseudomonadota bacterium]
MADDMDKTGEVMAERKFKEHWNWLYVYQLETTTITKEELNRQRPSSP